MDIRITIIHQTTYPERYAPLRTQSKNIQKHLFDPSIKLFEKRNGFVF